MLFESGKVGFLVDILTDLLFTLAFDSWTQSHESLVSIDSE